MTRPCPVHCRAWQIRPATRLGHRAAVSDRRVALQFFQRQHLDPASGQGSGVPAARLRLLASERTLELGTLSVTDATELLTFAGVERTGPGADVEFELEDDAGEVYRTSDGQALALTTAYTGDLDVRAILRGTSQASPILWPDLQIILGTLDDLADYVTRAIPADTSVDIAVVFEALTPGSSSVTVEAESGSAGNFAAVAFESAVQVGEDWTERTYRASGLSGVGLDLLTRVRLTLAGSPAHRPLVRKLRVVVT